jgi:hypothetical protein
VLAINGGSTIRAMIQFEVGFGKSRQENDTTGQSVRPGCKVIRDLQGESDTRSVLIRARGEQIRKRNRRLQSHDATLDRDTVRHSECDHGGEIACKVVWNENVQTITLSQEKYHDLIEVWFAACSTP